MQAMTWTIRVEMPRELRQRTAGLDRALRLSQRDRRRARTDATAEAMAETTTDAAPAQGEPDGRSSAA